MATESEYWWWERLFYGIFFLMARPVKVHRQALILNAAHNALNRYRRERWRSQ